MHRRRFLSGLAGAAVGAAVAGCLGRGESSGTDGYDVGMTASAFRPARYEIEIGDTVVWQNTNSRAHTVTAYGAGVPEGAEYFASGGFDSETAAREAYLNSFGGSLTSGDTYDHTFAVAGSYDYFCVPHERAGMRGTIVVTG